MTTPYPFQSGATLTAAQMNSLSELPVRSITASSTAIAADRYSRIIANGSAITYTLPSGVFEAGQVVQFHNINSTAATIAAGAGVTLNSAAGTTVAQYQSATIYAAGTASFVLFESDKTTSAGALVVVKAETTFSAVSSVTFDNVFTSTYADYEIIFRYTSSADSNLQMRLRASGSSDSTTNYNINKFRASATVATSNSTGQQQFFTQYAGQTNLSGFRMLVINPQVAAQTIVLPYGKSNSGGSTTFFTTLPSGSFTATTQFDGAEFFPTTGTITGSYMVYGYAKS